MLPCVGVVEDQLIAGIVGNDSGAAMQFRLAPAYTLYLLLRSCVSQPDLTATHRDRRIGLLANRMAQYLQQIVQVVVVVVVLVVVVVVVFYGSYSAAAYSSLDRECLTKVTRKPS